MRYFLVDDGDGQSVRSVPAGMELADLGVTEAQAAAAIQVPRPPKDDESWNATTGRWVRDEGAKARRDRMDQARAMSRVDILDRLEACERRLTALEAAPPGAPGRGS